MTTALLEGGPWHGRMLPDVYGVSIIIPGANGRYTRSGRLENGNTLWRWIKYACAHTFAYVGPGGSTMCRQCGEEIVEEMGG